jgi:putative phosphoesterase
VITDTHVGEHLPALPEEVLELFAGVDLILHAGDLTDPVVLRELGRVAPVLAVRGNHDDEGRLRGLPRDLVVSVAGVRIGLTHGTRPNRAELPAALLSLVAGRPVLLGFARAALRRVGSVDVLVTGHVHVPIDERVRGVRHFSPGAVYVPEMDISYDWSGPRGRAYRRVRSGLPEAARRSAVGLIEISGGEIATRSLRLRRPLRRGER